MRSDLFTDTEPCNRCRSPTLSASSDTSSDLRTPDEHKLRYEALLELRDAKALELEDRVNDLLVRVEDLNHKLDQRGRTPRVALLSPTSRDLVSHEAALANSYGMVAPMSSNNWGRLVKGSACDNDEPTPTNHRERRQIVGTAQSAATSASAYSFTDPNLDTYMKIDKGIPAPANFSGTDTNYGIYQFLQGLGGIKLKATTFRTEEDGTNYALTLLTGAAWCLIFPCTPSAISGVHCYDPIETVEQLRHELLERYGNVNTEGEAWTALQPLRQAHTNPSRTSTQNIWN